MKIDIWSDVICPFCTIGKRKLELALAQTGINADIEWHSFELNPHAPPSYGMPLPGVLHTLYGMDEDYALGVLAHEEAATRAVGLEFRWRDAKPGNTFDAHRLLHLGKSVGLGGVVKDRFLRAYFSEGQEIGNPAVLRVLAQEAGLVVVEVDRGGLQAPDHSAGERVEFAHARHVVMVRVGTPLRAAIHSGSRCCSRRSRRTWCSTSSGVRFR